MIMYSEKNLICISEIKLQSNISVIVAHPNKQHSYQLATALKKSGRLFKYCTTVYDNDRSLTSFVKKFSSSKYKEILKRKKCVALESNDVRQFCEFSGFIFIAMSRLPVFNRYYRFWGAWMNKRFGKRVAKFAIRNRVDAVVMYDTTADACFSYLKKHAPWIKRILDVSSNASAERVKLYDKEISKDAESELKTEYSFLWNCDFQNRNLREIQNSDYFLTPSSFSMSSIIAQEIDQQKIFVVHYGVDDKKFRYIPRNSSNNLSLKLVYTGVISYEKGVNYLLEALDKLPQESYSLYLMGVYNSQSTLYRKYKNKKNIHFMGYVSHNELSEIYSTADAFVMASLGEGFTLSGLEAMSCGLPVICSDNSGINDIIKNYENGIVFETGDELGILHALEWIAHNRGELTKMSSNAYKTSVDFTWDTYYKNIDTVFNKIFENTKFN